MPAPVRLMVFNFAVGTVLGLAVVALLFLGDGKLMTALGTAQDRLIAFVMLSITVAPSFGLGCMGTALCFSRDA